MPQLDVFTFLGQVTWFSLSFVIYFIAIGVIVLPLINRSVKLRSKKLAYSLNLHQSAQALLDSNQSILPYDQSMVQRLKGVNADLIIVKKAN